MVKVSNSHPHPQNKILHQQLNFRQVSKSHKSMWDGKMRGGVWYEWCGISKGPYQ
jgi:hypothetical protein